jgi:hypothetical protein
MTFRIRTHPGDVRLWLSVSRSPSVVNACGTIAHEVSIWSFKATTDSSVYEAKPTYYSYDAFWMNTAGTYYWQAHRIEYAGGADGCIESPIRSFKVTGSAPEPSPPPSPKPSPPPPPKPKPSPPSKAAGNLANARLAGEWDVVTRVTAVSGIDAKRGSTDSGTWRFTPTCPTGACNVRLRIEYGRLLTTEHIARLLMKKAGPAYKGSTATPLVECNFKDVVGTMVVRLKVTKGAWINGKWRATKIVGRYEYDAPATTSGIYRCPAARITSTVRGTLDE